MGLGDRNYGRHKSPALVAEQRMRQWTLGLEVKQRLDMQPYQPPLPRPIHPYVTISREAGAGGASIGRRVRSILDCDILDREILDDMAQRFKLPRDMLDFVDEKTSNWLLECFGKWISQRTVTQSEYVVHLGQIALMAAQHASTVFVGRGVRFLLPADRGLAIYLVGPLELRTKNICKRFDYSAAEASKYIRETDEGRRDFLRRNFNRDMDDPHNYDLVINRAYMSEDAAAELIVRQFRRRFPEIEPAGA
jgi:cytidylate kinase